MTEEVRRFARAYEAREGEARVTVYEAPNGRREWRMGGSPAWRNNNPGNIRASVYNKEQIGAAWGFAVFADREAGLRAMRDLLRRPLYGKLTLEAVIAKYAPPSDDNPTYAYTKFVSDRSGIGFGEVLGRVDEARFEKLVEAMATFERSVEGRVRRG